MTTHYRQLAVWNKAMELADMVYDLTQNFPIDEKFGLNAQMRRCAISIPSNIAEGHARESTKKYRHFLAVAKGSVAELETQILLAQRRKYIGDAVVQNALGLADEVNRMLTAIRKTLKEKLNSQSIAPRPLSLAPTHDS